MNDIWPRAIEQSLPSVSSDPQQLQTNKLKAVDTFGNCQRLASTVGVSQHMHEITNL